MSIGQLSLVKPGDERPKLSLNLSKPAVFSVELYWDSEADLDAHALLAYNDGSGAKVDDFGQVLSTYNCMATNKQGHLPANPDGSFSTPEGALRHSGDALEGKGSDADEIITVNGSKMPARVNEIPIFITIHHPKKPCTFNEVKNAGVRIKDGQGTVLQEYQLTSQFGQFDAVQMGSLILDENGWSFMAAGSGFNGTMNDILGYFS